MLQVDFIIVIINIRLSIIYSTVLGLLQ